MRWHFPNTLSPIRQWWADRRGAALDDLVMIAGVTVLGATFFIAGIEMWSAFHTQQVLQQAAQMANQDVVASGCLTDNAANRLASFLQSNGLQLSRVHLRAPSTSNVSYGARQQTVKLGYDVQFVVPFTSAKVWSKYLTVQIPADQSLYVPGDGAATSSCASNLKSVFAGTSNYGSGGGSTSGTSPSVNEVAALTLQANPNPVNVGEPTTLSGTATLASGADAPSGTQITIAGPTQTQAVDVGTNGTFAVTETSNTVGNATYTATAGTGTAAVTVDVVPSSAAALAINAPSSVTVGQAFSIQVSVNDAYGDPVANGTDVTISSSDSTDIPTTTEQTTNGSVTDTVTNGMTALGTYSITAKSGNVSQTVDITVNPGPPQTVTLNISPTTVSAGSAVHLTGAVDGPDGTPVATGTSVVVSSPSDTQDSFPITTTNSAGDYSTSATLTQTGTQTLIASVSSDGTSVSSVPESVTVTPGSAEQVVNFTATPNPVEQGATDTFTGTVEDQYGNVVGSGVSVTISGSDLTKAVTGTTNNQGAFSIGGTFQGAGTQTVDATSSGVALANGSTSVTVLATGADQLTASPTSATITAGGSTTVVWTLTDDTGTPVSGVPISFRLSNGDSSALNPTSATTNANGQVSVTVGPLTQAGTMTLEASDTNTTNVTGAMGITVQAGAPESVLNPVISPSVAQSTSDGGTVDPTITGTVVDAYGNPIPDASVSVTGGWDSGSFTGTTTSEGTFAIGLDPVTIGGPYHPTIAVSDHSGSNSTTYSSASLTVVQHVYQLTLSPANGSSSTPAGTPYGITATLTEAGAPVSGASITFTVPSGDTATTWAANGTTPNVTGPTSITATTNSSGQVTVEAAFENNTGSQTVRATYPRNSTNATLSVDVSANQPSTVTWTTPDPNPVAAGSSFVTQGTLIDSYGFPVAAGEPVTVAFASDLNETWTTRAGGVIGYANASDAAQWFTPSKAGTWDVVIFAVDGTQYNQSGDPTLPDVAETVDPGPIAYFWPVLANTSDQWEPGMSWTDGANASQGPTNAYGTLNIDTPTNGQPFALAGIGYDAYGNEVDSGAATASVSCSAASGGTCPSLPGSVNGGYANTGGFTAGSYTLNFTPTGSPYPSGVSPVLPRPRLRLVCSGYEAGMCRSAMGRPSWVLGVQAAPLHSGRYPAGQTR